MYTVYKHECTAAAIVLFY